MQHANRLEQMSRSALPVVVRQTLNAAAFDVKTDTMPESAKRFIHRKATFFQANSGVTPATGFDINTMSSTVGFKPKPNDKSHSVEDLEQQEDGGHIDNRAFIAIPAGRNASSWRKMVRKNMTLAYINSRQSIGTQSSIVDSLHATGKNKKQRFIKSAVAAGKGGFVLGTHRVRGSRMLMYINSIKRVGRDMKINSTAIYSVKAGRQVTPDGKFHGFMKHASQQSAAKMQRTFIILAEKKLKGIR